MRLLITIAAALALVPASASAQTQPLPGHVWTIMLENKDYEQTFGANPGSPYLGKTLPSQGALVANYYATGHNSLDNYISMISGQAPNPFTQADCPTFQDFAGGAVGVNGQAVGMGCVYPSNVKTVADQLNAKKIAWRAYMQDMGADPAREAAACGHPPVNGQDNTQVATAKDQYATRHNPFMYFHSIIDDKKSCAADVVNLSKLSGDLASLSTTPQFSFISPDLCADGHDATCVDMSQKGGYEGINDFLTTWVPKITASPAYKQDGLIIITFDEAEGSDSTACCNEPTGPNTPRPGINGPGGGKMGAVLLSPFIKPGTQVQTPINHYGYLRSIEDLFGLPRLGYAGLDGTATFQSMNLFTVTPSVPAAKAVKAFSVSRKGRTLTIQVSLAPGVVGKLAISRKGKIVKRFVTGATATFHVNVAPRAKVVLRATQNGRTLKKLSRSR